MTNKVLSFTEKIKNPAYVYWVKTPEYVPMTKGDYNQWVSNKNTEFILDYDTYIEVQRIKFEAERKSMLSQEYISKISTVTVWDEIEEEIKAVIEKSLNFIEWCK